MKDAFSTAECSCNFSQGELSKNRFISPAAIINCLHDLWQLACPDALPRKDHTLWYGRLCSFIIYSPPPITMQPSHYTDLILGEGMAHNFYNDINSWGA